MNKENTPGFGNRTEDVTRVQSGLQKPRTPAEAIRPREVPPPPKRNKGIVAQTVVVMNFFLTCIVLAVIAMCGAAYWGKHTFEKAGPLQEPRTIVIDQGNGLNQIASRLVANGVIENDMVFRLWVRAHGASGQMKAGEYVFEPRSSMYQVMDTIRSGNGIVHKVSIPEGFTVYQIFQRLRDNDVLEGDLPSALPPEGSLMPDTYPFRRGTTREQVVERMKLAQQEYLDSVWEKRIDGLPLSSPQELVTLASIVEKETGRADERPRVASVFINRLRRGMKLQSDPTIIYGIFGGEGKPRDRPIYRSDIDKPTPYNTYVIPALPPGPIANPGRAALEAVANPSRTEDLFFVANGTGGHSFAKTLDEHNQNVARWRVIEKQLKEDAEKRAAEQQQSEDASQ